MKTRKTEPKAPIDRLVDLTTNQIRKFLNNKQARKIMDDQHGYCQAIRLIFMAVLAAEIEADHTPSNE